MSDNSPWAQAAQAAHVADLTANRVERLLHESLRQSTGRHMSEGMSDLITAKIEASEARTDTKFARSDARFDALMTKLDSISEDLRGVRDDNRNTRSTVRNSAFALAGLFLAIVALGIAGAALLPNAYSFGLSTRELIQTEVQKATPVLPNQQ